MSPQRGSRRSISLLRVLFPRALLVAVLSLMLLACFWPAESYAQERRPIVIIPVSGPINSAKADFLSYALERAESRGAKLAVITLNTPGGLLISMKLMVESMLEAHVPTVVYVSPSGGGAISAGVFIAYAANRIFMAPGTNMGAAHPVSSSGRDIGGDMREKIENYAVSLLKSIAERRGRDVAWAELAVRESIAVTAQEASDLKLIDAMALDLETLLAKLEGETLTVGSTPVSLTELAEAPREVIPMTLRQEMVDILCNPNITILFGLGALVGIGLELMVPGMIVPGLFGAICLILSLIGGHSLPITAGGAVLLLMSAVLALIELFVPAFGAFGIASVICFVLGCIYFVDLGAIWGVQGFEVDFLLLLPTAATAMLLAFAAALFIFRPKNLVRKHGESLIGQGGEIIKAFSGSEGSSHAYGKIRCADLVLPAVFADSDRADLQVGARVEIVGLDTAQKHVVAVVDKSQ